MFCFGRCVACSNFFDTSVLLDIPSALTGQPFGHLRHLGNFGCAARIRCWMANSKKKLTFSLPLGVKFLNSAAGQGSGMWKTSLFLPTSVCLLQKLIIPKQLLKVSKWCLKRVDIVDMADWVTAEDVRTMLSPCWVRIGSGKVVLQCNCWTDFYPFATCLDHVLALILGLGWFGHRFCWTLSYFTKICLFNKHATIRPYG